MRRTSMSSTFWRVSLLTLFRRPDREIPPPVVIMKSLVACTFLVLVASCSVAASNTTLTTTSTTTSTTATTTTTATTATTVIESRLNISSSSSGSRPAADGLPDHYCPSTCFCDLDSSLVSCAGAEDDAVDVIWGDHANQTKSVGVGSNGVVVSVGDDIVANIADDVWSVVGATGIQRLDVRDLILERLDKTLVNGTERLNELSLVRCGLLSIGNRTFADHSNLERLDLSQNQLTILSQVSD